MATRSSTAQWEGDLKAGKGTMTVGKGAYTGPFSFASRFEDASGTNPEELIAAAHADVHFGPDPAGGFHVSLIELVVDAQVPGIDNAKFQEIAEDTRKGCPISKLMKAEIVVKATLKG